MPSLVVQTTWKPPANSRYSLTERNAVGESSAIRTRMKLLSSTTATSNRCVATCIDNGEKESEEKFNRMPSEYSLDGRIQNPHPEERRVRHPATGARHHGE